MDIASLGRSVGGVVLGSTAQALYADCARCVREAEAAAAPGTSRVRTLILPHDATREPANVDRAREDALLEPEPPAEPDADAAT
eukprot:5854868-Prymnesium_polylepis.1